ncbi:FecR family protein [Pedobacter sp. N36a]|uniref:FecR family protein n=1 Tax=Pedobacter sp. N36a TaxID=2767996 RepID=UPI0016573817|nr:FecR family protein [Pedobacter sp. N36a]MBC8984945.1 FecR family protein [Pedobacter sp. N36a]
MNLRIVYLRARQRANTISDLQKKELLSWLTDPANESEFEELTEELWANPESRTPVFKKEESQAMLKNIMSAVRTSPDEEHKSVKLKPNLIPLWLKISAAAVFISLSAVLFFYVNSSNKFQKSELVSIVKPGTEKAFLTLADGTKFSLADLETGDEAKFRSNGISKTKDGFLVYKPVAQQLQSQIKGSNVLMTPKGGQYKIMLPDGTKVWMNAASTLTFPLTFDGRVRMVELAGEAYFEVAKDKSKAFKVRSLQQEVEVYGTHFNINSYPEEAKVVTTLLEGSVGVTDLKSGKHLMLKPGQQALLTNTNTNNNADAKASANGNSLSLAPAQLEEALAWKEGYFLFEHEELGSIMRKLSRWYNIEIQFKNEELKSVRFAGTVDRFQNLADVLRMLDLTGNVKFKIEGRTVIAYK